jgi:apoptotic protease-activating factor
LYDLQELVPIFVLESHRAPITNLHFSPWLENEGPIVLTSLADSVNFWNVTHVINNKLGDMKRNSKEPSKSRLSQRFKASLIISPALPTQNSVRKISLQEKNWSNKTGPFNKRELLSCIKFLGKNAKKLIFDETFTRFITIDSEGNIYHLRLIDQNQNMAVEDIDNSRTIKFE